MAASSASGSIPSLSIETNKRRNKVHIDLLQ